MPSRPRRVVKRWLREGGDLLEVRRRRASADERVLPDFLIIGAQKAGTTSLFEYLAQHPSVALPKTKEVHYFDLHHDDGESWYRAMLPLRSEVPPGTLAGEASPYYLFHPLVPGRAHSLLPAARLVVLVRDPVERAWSHYRHEIAGGREPLQFPDALDAEPRRLAAAEPAILAGRNVDAHQNHSYVARGRYAEQLRRWYAEFPREQVHVVIAEDLFAEPATAYDGVLRFLGLPEGHRPTFDAHNARRDTGLDPSVRRRLEAEFAGPNADLVHLLGRDVPWAY